MVLCMRRAAEWIQMPPYVRSPPAPGLLPGEQLAFVLLFRLEHNIQYQPQTCSVGNTTVNSLEHNRRYQPSANDLLAGATPNSMVPYCTARHYAWCT